MSDPLKRIADARYLFKLILLNDYYQVRMHAEDVSFTTPYGNFEFKIFSLSLLCDYSLSSKPCPGSGWWPLAIPVHGGQHVAWRLSSS